MKKLPLLLAALASRSLLLAQAGNVDLGGYPTTGYAVYETWTTSAAVTSANTLVQRDSSNPITYVVPASAASSWDVLGIATNTALSGSSLSVARYGQAQCIVDASGAGATTAGHLAVMGITNNVDCADSGQTNVDLIPIGTRVVGYFLQGSVAAGSTAWVELTPGLMGTELTGVPLSATSFSTSSNASINGSVYSTQNVYAGTSSSAPGCVHLSDTGQTHDMGVCAPASGFSGLLDLPAAGPLWLGSFMSGWQISGVSVTGSSSNTCTVAFSGGGGTGATATVTLTAALSSPPTVTLNSSNATITVSAPGSGYAGPPTMAAMGSGTATCSGTGPFTGANMVSGQLLTASGSDSNGNSTTAWAGLPSGDILVGSGSGAPAPVVMSGDCTFANTGTITCTKTNGVAFAPSATTDTTNATNITSGSLLYSLFPSNFSLSSKYNLTWTPQAWTGGSTPTILSVAAPTQTGPLPSGEVQDLNWNGARTLTITNGGYANQRAVFFQAPTYAYTSATMVSSAAALAISGPPAAGSSATFTGSYGLWVESGVLSGAGGTVGSAYALRADAPSGATNNYAAYLNGSTAIGPSAGSSAGPNTTLTVYNGGSGTTELVVKAASSQGTTPLLSVNNNSGTPQAQIDQNFNATAQMFHSTSSAPTAACGSGAGTGCSYLVSTTSTNNAGSFQVTTAGTPSVSAAVVTISFAGTVTNTPGACVIGPANPVTARIASASQPYVSSVSTTNFVVTSNTTALSLTTYAWWYVCM